MHFLCRVPQSSSMLNAIFTDTLHGVRVRVGCLVVQVQKLGTAHTCLFHGVLLAGCTAWTASPQNCTHRLDGVDCADMEGMGRDDVSSPCAPRYETKWNAVQNPAARVSRCGPCMPHSLPCGSWLEPLSSLCSIKCCGIGCCTRTGPRPRRCWSLQPVTRRCSCTRSVAVAGLCFHMCLRTYAGRSFQVQTHGFSAQQAFLFFPVHVLVILCSEKWLAVMSQCGQLQLPDRKCLSGIETFRYGKQSHSLFS